MTAAVCACGGCDCRRRVPLPPTPLMIHRIGVWERGCKAGLSREEIADRLDITPQYLSKVVTEGRARGMEGAFAKPKATYRPRPEIVRRLRRWKQLCALGWTTQEIADELRVNARTLERCVSRARRHGWPDAVQHPDAGGRGGWTRILRPTPRRRDRAHASAA